ncbi:LysE family translocator [Serratia oryzae]|jgi:RhtB (resistance to homoserine/threonine) family protein|uniref:Amino acid transporter n=1 Tax=Serratia oryzae TaxID=2034155 RepID=A0A1S8CJI1_9GAMM|nr:LysE family transporter [Serratia oryzae]OMQ22816.1 amino acid transporter [Serratia oryzae]
MTELLAVFIITLFAVISPGPDFAMVSRNSLLLSRRAGLLNACGIGASVLIHVSYTLIGVGMLILQSLWLFSVFKIVSAIWLVYLGVSLLRQANHPLRPQTSAPSDDLSALKTGFLTNLLNPKATLFIVSLFVQVVNPQTPLAVQIGYGLFISLAHVAWFSLVALFFSSPGINAQFLRIRKTIDRLFGGVLIVFGTLLLASNLKPQ